MRALTQLGVMSLASVLFAACAVSSGGVSGGEVRVDAASLPGPVVDSGPQDSGSGTKFSDLYRDFFGPSAGANRRCAGSGVCHGGAAQEGTKATGGYICAADPKECRSTLLSTGLIAPGVGDFTKTTLYLVLRKEVPGPDGGPGSVAGSMPKSSTFTFSKDDLDRIATWVAAGTPDD